MWWIILGIWTAGWLAFLVMLPIASRVAYNTRLNFLFSWNEDRAKGWSRRQVIAGIVFRALFSFLYWPFILPGIWESLWPHVAVAVRMRPRWSLEPELEESERTWNTKTGSLINASVRSYGPSSSAEIEVESDDDLVDYRVKMLAPKDEAPTGWRRMKRLRQTEYDEEIEEYRHEMDEDSLKKKPPLRANRKLERGRYQVDFRVENPEGEFEEFSGLILVVY